jgi:uncharacterized protein CbrC (UPF0167 family)
MLEFTLAEVLEADLVKTAVGDHLRAKKFTECLVDAFIGAILQKPERVSEEAMTACGMYMSLSKEEYYKVCGVGLLVQLARAKARIAALEDAQATRIELVIQDAAAKVG